MKVKNNYFLFLIIIASTFKLLFFLFAEHPNLFPDSGGFIQLAQMISNFNLSGYNGVRTPGYPLIIAICNMNLSLVVAFQMILGIFISLLMFKTTYLFTLNTKFAFISALTYLFYVPQFNIERAIVSETTATFLATASVYFCVLYILREKLFYKIFISVILGCFAALTRPLFILLPFFILVFFSVDAICRKEYWRRYVSRLTTMLLITIISITSWSYVNYKNNNVFTVSTLSGLGITNAVGGFMIPRNDQFKEIRDIYLKHRAIVIEKTGTYENTIFQAYDEMQQVTGLSYVSLSVQLQKMSRLEIIMQPLFYTKHVIDGAYRFWNPLADRDSRISFSLRYIPSTISRIGILIINILFILGIPILMLIGIFKKKVDLNRLFFFIGIYTFVFCSSIAQGMVEYGTNRYSLPYQPITSCFALISTFYLIANVYQSSKIAKLLNISNLPIK